MSTNTAKRFLAGLLVLALALAVTPGILAAGSGGFGGGDGTAENPYLISAAGQLDLVREHLDAHFKLTADLTLTGADFAEGGQFYYDGQGWLPIGSKSTPFTGVFDGDGHSISGLWMNVREEESRLDGGCQYIGLFGYSQGVIENLRLEAVFEEIGMFHYFQKPVFAGAVLGYNDGGSVVNCAGDVKLELYGYMGRVLLGGIVGFSAGGSIEACSVTGGVIGQRACHAAGGIVGGIERGAVVSGCINGAQVNLNDGADGFAFAGGIVGENRNSYVLNCQNGGEIVGAMTSPTGGIAGNNASGVIDKCTNSGLVVGMDYAGGIAAWSQYSASITDCTNTGNVQSAHFSGGYGSNSGGIVGSLRGQSQVLRCSNAGEVYGQSCSGGIAGIANDSVIAQCVQTGTCKTMWDVAGIAAYSDGLVLDCYSTGTVTAADYDTGGIVAENLGTVENCYHAGTIVPADRPMVDGTIGVIAGRTESGAVKNCYYLSGALSGGTEAGTACIEEQFCRQSTFAGFDFDGVWQLGSGGYRYPQLLDNWMDGPCPVEREPAAAPAVHNPFQDVTTERFFYNAVLWAASSGVANGMDDVHFMPDLECTRGQVVTFLWRAMGQPEPESTVCPFTDVAENRFYYKAILWAAENGITNGMTATTFGPEETVTRGQFVTFLWRAEGTPDATGGNPFTDVAEARFYYNAVVWAAANGITSGIDATHFAPEKTCTRGQVVTFLYRDLGEQTQ